MIELRSRRSHRVSPSSIITAIFDAKVIDLREICDMVFHMKTTLNIDDTVVAELKREAARQGRTMSELVETALRLLLRSQRKRAKIPVLPRFRSGGTLVNVADRDASTRPWKVASARRRHQCIGI